MPTEPDGAARVLLVDDEPRDLRLLEAVLTPHGCFVTGAASGQEALEAISGQQPDLILMDLVMPDMSGVEVCRRLRADQATAALPVIMLTGNGDGERIAALDAGADDFLAKPFDHVEVLARVRSLLRIKRCHDTIRRQGVELGRLSQSLEDHVRAQAEESETVGGLRRFLSPQVAEMARSNPSMLERHRREISVLFCDLRGFTAFTEAAEPEDVSAALADFHEAVGELVQEYEATVGHFAGDGLMAFLNDPLPSPGHVVSAVQLAMAIRDRMNPLCAAWSRSGHHLGLGIGLAVGYATVGRVGFAGRFDYAPIGRVVNLASRLCDEAPPGAILVSQAVHAEIEDVVASEPAGEFTLKGFRAPVPAFRLGAGRARVGRSR